MVAVFCQGMQKLRIPRGQNPHHIKNNQNAQARKKLKHVAAPLKQLNKHVKNNINSLPLKTIEMQKQTTFRPLKIRHPTPDTTAFAKTGANRWPGSRSAIRAIKSSPRGSGRRLTLTPGLATRATHWISTQPGFS